MLCKWIVKRKVDDDMLYNLSNLHVSYIVPGSAYIASGHAGIMPVSWSKLGLGLGLHTWHYARLTLHIARFIQSPTEFYYMVTLKCYSSFIIALITVLINKFCSLRSPLSNLLIRISIKAIMKEE